MKSSQDTFVSAVKALKVGKKLPGATYVHTSVVPTLPNIIVSKVGAAMLAAGVGPGDFELVKLGSLKATVSLLKYPGFWTEPFPALAEHWSVDLSAGSVPTAKHRVWPQNDATPILHRKESFLLPTDPAVPALTRVTRELEALGLFKHTSRIGQRGVWEKMLRDAGVDVVGQSVVRRRPNPRAEPGVHESGHQVDVIGGITAWVTRSGHKYRMTLRRARLNERGHRLAVRLGVGFEANGARMAGLIIQSMPFDLSQELLLELHMEAILAADEIGTAFFSSDCAESSFAVHAVPWVRYLWTSKAFRSRVHVIGRDPCWAALPERPVRARAARTGSR